MLIDTHCHLNMIVKKDFDRLLTNAEIAAIEHIINDATTMDVKTIINVGTSIIESKNCVELAQRYNNVFASIGIHPNDCTQHWREEIRQLEKMLQSNTENKIVAIGEIGFDKHYPNYNLARQKDAFKAQVELALKFNLPIIIHSREASHETLMGLEEFEHESLRGIIHCFSEDLSFAHEAIARNFLIGIGGTLTYPANDALREVCRELPLEKIVLETDAPFLPPQIMRGKQNSPKYIQHIAQYLAQLIGSSIEEVAKQTTANALDIFKLNDCM